VLKLFRHVCNLLMSIVEDRRHVDVPSHSVKFDSSHGLMHPLMSTATIRALPDLKELAALYFG
jgi:hypothetical protein